MKTPLIGITTNRNPTSTRFQSIVLSESYTEAVQAAGGIPVLIPVGQPPSAAAAICASLDGILFSGGGDMDPVLFDGQPHPSVNDIDAARDAIEMALARETAQTKTPFFGICRGIQVLNVAFGGTLYTDVVDQLPGAIKHDYYPNIPRNTLAHKVKLDETSQLAAILGSSEVQVNSLHHQGVLAPAAGVRVTGHAPDGLIEAFELPGHPFGIGVQWHPEWLQEWPSMQALFRAFVQAAAQTRS